MLLLASYFSVLQLLPKSADVPHLNQLREYTIAQQCGDEPREVAHWQRHKADVTSESGEWDGDADSHDCKGHQHEWPGGIALSGLDLCRLIRAEQPKIAILMLTALGTTDDKLDGFDAGADDYMTKPFDFRELLARIAVLLRRNKVTEASDAPATEANILTCADLQLDLDRHLCKRGGVDIHLTPKEFSLLRYLLENKGRIVTRADIQGAVWGTHFDTGTNFIDVYINYLRRKVDHAYSLKLIHNKPGVGFILSQEV